MMKRKVKKRSYRIKSRIRFTVFAAGLLIMTAAVFNSLLGLGDVSSMTVPQYKEVVVESGDTLWQIASEHQADDPDRQDIRKRIHQICRINGISADTLYPGQVLMIPVG